MSAGPTLLAFDFDGTLAPIRSDPAEVRAGRAATALLAEAAQTEGVVVAVVSGRDLQDLLARLSTPGIYLVGSHGLEILGPGGVLVRQWPGLALELDPVLQEEIAGSGLLLEKKKHAYALHWRGVPYEAIEPVAAMFRQWSRAAGLDVIEGRCVVEARCPGAGKEEALRWLARMIGVDRVIYAGDDVTDFGPLRFAAERGRALFVASDERVPPAGVTVVSSFRDLFRLVREEVLI